MIHFAIAPRDVAAFVLVMAIWGFNFAVVKTALETFPPIFMTALRFAMVAAVLLPFVAIPRGHFLGVFLVSVTLGFLHFSLMFTGLDGIDASTAAIAIQLQVPFAALLAAFVFGDKLGWRRALGMATAFAGVAVIAGEPRMAGSYLSLGLVVTAAMIFAISNIQVKKLGTLNGWTVAGWMSFFAVPQLFAASLLLEDGQIEALRAADWLAWGCIVYNAIVVMVIGYGLWYRLLRRYEVNTAMPFTLLVPLFGVMTGVLVLGETLDLSLILGGLLTIVGVGIIILRRPKVVAPEADRV
ncbi:DMT family transporter [Algihabitans albus]|uniref:DMT family transporter n=1 Tax=Algihabitans albus TaxID=2164067 RepID=UPI000E5C9A63|nr:EamA family transporter [Algihabitans albus]